MATEAVGLLLLVVLLLGAGALAAGVMLQRRTGLPLAGDDE